MTIQEFLNSKEVEWLISKSKRMVDDFEQDKEIPGSCIFIGSMPKRMIQNLRIALEKVAEYRDCGREVVYSISTGDTENDWGYTFSFGAFKSTGLNLKFTACPYTW